MEPDRQTNRLIVGVGVKGQGDSSPLSSLFRRGAMFNIYDYIAGEIKKYQDEYPDAIIEDVEFSKNDDGEYIMIIIAKHPKAKELP
ncbi:hypothetical protein SEA_BILO_51 [Streptomyces phage Bilo]|nr:hypothetical protein SEA_BILO_51 [Streptomyces phage Bilo]